MFYPGDESPLSELPPLHIPTFVSSVSPGWLQAYGSRPEQHMQRIAVAHQHHYGPSSRYELNHGFNSILFHPDPTDNSIGSFTGGPSGGYDSESHDPVDSKVVALEVCGISMVSINVM
jgi:hypothetical protein